MFKSSFMLGAIPLLANENTYKGILENKAFSFGQVFPFLKQIFFEESLCDRFHLKRNSNNCIIFRIKPEKFIPR